jgi:hypothetical protein
MNRKFLAAKEEIVRELSSIAEKKKTTLYGLTNDILEQAIKVHKTGDELPKIIGEHLIIQMAKQNGCLLIPERIWYTVLDRALRTDRASIKETCHESGLWYGKYFSTIMSDTASTEAVQSALRTVFWNASSLDVSRADDRIIVRCIEPSFTDSHTEFVSIMLEGIMDSLGYAVNEREVSRGLITLTLTDNSTGKREDVFKER